ncbi:hypothetical protein [Macrococcus bovicus]|nr:hypothetical protein [Macrococcus bovicus]
MKRLLTVMSLSTLMLTACQAEQAPEEQTAQTNRRRQLISKMSKHHLI